MNAPTIWILMPLITAAILLLIRKYELVSIFIGASVSLLLLLSAWSIPVGEVVVFGNRSLKIADSLQILGRDLILSNHERPMIAMLYTIALLWVIASAFVKVPRGFVPYVMLVVALINAVISVEPFLYAALILELIVLISIPLLVEPGQVKQKGVLRFLSFQTISLPFILFTSWMILGIEAGPGELALLNRAGILIFIGLAFGMSIFPFHNWIPMVAEESHPFVVSFVITVYPLGVSLFALGLIDRYVWLREATFLNPLLLNLGALMVLFGGLWAAFERQLGRMLGFTAVMEIGSVLLALSLSGPEKIYAFISLLLPRVLNFIGIAISASKINQINQYDLSLEKLRGKAYQAPVHSLLLVLSLFSLAGTPILAGYQIKVFLWKQIFAQSSWMAIFVFLGAAALLVAALRLMLVLFVADPEHDAVDEKAETQAQKMKTIISWFTFSIFLALNIFLGVFPLKFSNFLQRFVEVFEHFGSIG